MSSESTAGPGGDPGAADDPRGVVVFTGTTPFEAQVVAEMLRAEGIPLVTTPDRHLIGVEFNAARQAMGLEGTEVRVPPSWAKRARLLIDAAKRRAEAEGDAS
ncbi:MAG: hypothetical protein ACYTG6_08065 [Planctomycetota bacterium]